MSDQKPVTVQVVDLYKGLRTLGGVVLDEESFQKHQNAYSQTADIQLEQQPSSSEAADPFAQPQDFRQIAAQAFDTDQQEYRPDTAIWVPMAEETGQTLQMVGDTMLVRSGSGSYYSSGSYRMTSGSYRISSGSYRMTSGSFRLSSGSYRVTSGSFRLSSGSYRAGSGRFGSGSYCVQKNTDETFDTPPSMESLCPTDQPYMGSFYWKNRELGGYGLELI